MASKQKRELTWLGKDKKIKIEASNFINDEELKKLKYLKNIKTQGMT